MQPADAAKCLESESRSAVTDASGSVTFTNLPVGLYYVRETPPKDTTHHWAWADPFLITFPTGDINGTQWDYNVEMVAKPTAEPFGVLEPTPTPAPSPTPTQTTTAVPTVPNIPGIPSQSSRPSTPPSSKTTPARPTPGHPATTTHGGGGDASGQGQSTPGLFGGGNSGRSGISSLASTGANVIGIIIAGLLLIALGIFLSRRKKED